MGTTAEALRGDLATDRANLGADLEAIGDRVSPKRMVQRRRAKTRQRFRSLSDRVMGTAHDMRHSVSESVSGASSSVTGAGSSIAESARHAPDAVRHTTEGNPLAAGMVAFGFGLVVAALLPESEPEHQLAEKMQPRLEQMAESVGEAAQEVVDAVKPIAQEAAADIRSGAKDAAADVKASATHAASEVKDATKPSR